MPQIKDFSGDIGKRPSRKGPKKAFEKHCGPVLASSITDLAADSEVLDITVRAVNAVGPGATSKFIPKARTLGKSTWGRARGVPGTCGPSGAVWGLGCG